MCQGQRLPAWGAECVRHLLASSQAEPVLFIKDVSEPRAPVWSAQEVLYRFYAEHWVRRRSRALQMVELADELAQIEQLEWDGHGASESFSAEEVIRIRSCGLDFILCFGARSLRGEVLRIPRFGVWSYRHGRGTAPCFWEVFAGEPKTRAVLQKLSTGAEADLDLRQGYFGTCRASWVNNIDRAFLGSADWCARACAEISASEREPLRHQPSSGQGWVDRSPNNGELLRFLLRSGSHMFAKLWELLFHVEVWNVGFSANSVEEIVRDAAVDAETVTWCRPHKSGNFIADPFVFTDQGEHHVLVEDYDRGKGRICTLVKPQAAQQLDFTVGFEESYHMSYPCIFCEDGVTYCIPETYQWGRVGLYKRVNDSWELVRTILEGQPVVDPTLFKYGELYWLLFTLQNDGAWGNLKLYAYHAESLHGEWRAHCLNPVKCDIGSSRPAGSPVWVDGQLYRPSQDCSVTYGGAVVMNRIVKLSPTEFEEVEAARIKPMKDGPYPDGLHTINPMGTETVIDSKTFLFSPLAWRQNWGRLHEVFR